MTSGESTSTSSSPLSLAPSMDVGVKRAAIEKSISPNRASSTHFRETKLDQVLSSFQKVAKARSPHTEAHFV